MTATRHLPLSHPVLGLVSSGAMVGGDNDSAVGRAVESPTAPGFSYTVACIHDAVMVAGHGEPDAAGSAKLRGVLSDLIEGQGNRISVVEVAAVGTVNAAGGKAVLSAAATPRRGTRTSLNTPGATPDEASVSMVSQVTGGPLR